MSNRSCKLSSVTIFGACEFFFAGTVARISCTPKISDRSVDVANNIDLIAPPEGNSLLKLFQGKVTDQKKVQPVPSNYKMLGCRPTS
jgi:hypothetical protein